jgi:hypothetical protein
LACGTQLLLLLLLLLLREEPDFESAMIFAVHLN